VSDLVNTIPRELYPFEGRYFDRGAGVRMHYLDEGEGPPVVMVHGNPTWSFYYRQLVLALRDGHRCIVPDHVGMGLSDKPGDDRYAYTLAQRVDDLEALLEHLGVDRDVTLVVHDWGGMIGMAWAARHPERVARLVILNTAAFPLPSDKPTYRDFDYSPLRRADCLGRLLHSLGLTRDRTLVVHDWGGMIGMAPAARHPERINRLFLLNTAAPHLPK